MSNYILTNEELQNSLEEQLYFLESSLNNFSSFEFEAKRVALTIRILLHDTSRSQSLLNQLKIKEKVKYINSAPENDGRLHSLTNMVDVRGKDPNQYFGLVAKINIAGKLTSVPLFMQHLPQWYKSYKYTSFEEWWGMEIINVGDISLTRKEVILYIANKDGGSHIDSEISLKYFKIKNTKLKLNIKGIMTEFDKNVVYASVVQTGWEILKSINQYFSREFFN